MKEIYKYLPYKLTKRIDKTGEGRSGLEIYKRRNRRDYRVIIQYKIWNKLMEKSSYMLNEFKEGFAVLISPEEYFGDNYPNKSHNLNPKFILGETGFIYYSNDSEYNNYPLLPSWKEVYEISTTGSLFEKTWIGNYALNIKNSIPPKISTICGKYNNNKDKQFIYNFIQQKYPDIKKIPSQSGLGNYDYDYASKETIKDVKYQMLYLALCAKEENGTSFFQYLENHTSELKEEKKDIGEPYKTLFSNPKYSVLAENEFKRFEKKCKDKNLLDFKELARIGAWDLKKHVPICPLCGKEIKPHEFFKSINQAEGREVSDNTQRDIVLMHIKALKPGELNHKPYNLGWGHHFCNTIQGDKDIEETIQALFEILENHHKH